MWAIIADGGALEFDSLMGLDITDESTVIDEPIEKGSFASYNKLDLALRIRIVLGFNGNEAAFNERWAELKELKSSLDLVGVIAGQAYFENMSIETLRWSRQADVGFYMVDLTLVEIREVETQTTTTEYSRPKVKRADSMATVDTGKTDPRERTSILYDIKEEAQKLKDWLSEGLKGSANATN